MKIIIIGGGISGVFAAIELSKRKHDVTILERNDRILKKMLVTGNGRCNLTNANLGIDNYNCKDDLVKKSLPKFSNYDFINYLRNLGILTTEENNGKIFPVTLKAQSVVNMLLEELKELNVEILTSKKVISIEKNKVNNKFEVLTEEEKFLSDKVMVAVGGASMPSSGSDGKSYKLLEKLGHKIEPVSPALTQIKLDSKYLKHLSGVKVVGEVNLYEDKILADRKYGEILFTSYGVSGPPILDISRTVNNLNGNITIVVPLINNIKSKKMLKEELYSRFYEFGYFSVERWLLGLVDKKFIYMILDNLKLDKNNSIDMLSEKEFERLFNMLIGCEFIVDGTKGFENSQVTSGGILTSEIETDTFESKKVKGVYIIGEVMDVDGVCGGYNIQWAATSAIIAANSINESN